MELPRSYFRYLPVYPEIEDWGARVLDAGFTKVPKDTDYPAPGHPDDHHFSWESGRRLNAFTFVYITHGSGIFDSENSGEVRLEAGDVFVLMPGVWHRYRPHRETGWDEYWVECAGTAIDEAVRRIGLDAKKPILKVGHDEALLREFHHIFETIAQERPGFQAVAGLQSLVVVAMIRSLAKLVRESGASTQAKLVRQSIAEMRDNLKGRIVWEDLARKLGVSYSSFRRSFRHETGRSPGDYFIGMKLNMAKQLLEMPERSVQDISLELGFESASYFSNLFKSRVGMSPSEFRKNG